MNSFTVGDTIYTRRLIPRVMRKARRRITQSVDGCESTVTCCSSSETEFEDEDSQINLLVKLMDYDDYVFLMLLTCLLVSLFVLLIIILRFYFYYFTSYFYLPKSQIRSVCAYGPNTPHQQESLTRKSMTGHFSLGVHDGPMAPVYVTTLANFNHWLFEHGKSRVC